METTFEIYNFPDDGVIPNSKYPVIVYHQAIKAHGNAAADLLEQRFAQHRWTNATNNHEVLGVYAGLS